MSQFSSIITSTPSRKRAYTQSGSSSMKKARVVTKRTRISRSIKMHSFVRNVTNEAFPISIITGGATPGFNASGISNMQINFMLSGINLYLGGTTWTTLTMPNYAEFTTLYDQFRIDWVEGEIYFSANSAESVSANNGTLPMLICAKDYDDSNTATSTDLAQYNNCQYWQLGNMAMKKKINIKPNVDIAVFNGLTNGYARAKPMFIDTASFGVPHYGLKLATTPIVTPPANNTNLGSLFFRFRYHITMNNTR